MRRVIIGLFVVLIAACEPPPVEVVFIKDAEHREYFKGLLVKEKIPFKAVAENGQDVLRFKKQYSDKVHSLLNEYGGKSIEPGRVICSQDKVVIDKEVNKLRGAKARFSLVKLYADTCITWDAMDADIVEGVIYKR